MRAAPDAEGETGSSVGEVRRKAASGAMLLGARAFLVRVIGFGGNVVVARLLTPRDFGLVAIGYVIIAAGGTLTDGGLGASLVRGPVAPTRKALASVSGFQLLGALVIVGLTGGVTAILGGPALITLVMVCSLPILAVQTPIAITLERELNYRPLAMSDITQTIVYNVGAIFGVAALGAGVWALAVASVAGTLASTLLLAAMAPVGFVRPRLSIEELRPILGFGVRFQAVDLIGLLRDQGFNTVTAALGGLGTLGLWSLSGRVLSPGTLVFETLRRVSYPGMARLRDLGDDARTLVARTLALTCVGGSLVLVPLAASAHPLMNVAFGHRWEPAATVVALGAGSLLLSGPLSVAGAGFLFAEGHAGEALRIVVAHTVIGLVCVIALLPILGIDALGIAMVVMGVIDLLMFGAAFVRRVPGVLPVRILWRPVAVSLVGIAGGAVAAAQIGNDLVALAASASLAFAVTLAGHWLTDRATLTGLAMTTRRSLRRS
jgi:O-antigen/teichoic acid export membrane protein